MGMLLMKMRLITQDFILLQNPVIGSVMGWHCL